MFKLYSLLYDVSRQGVEGECSTNGFRLCFSRLYGWSRTESPTGSALGSEDVPSRPPRNELMGGDVGMLPLRLYNVENVDSPKQRPIFHGSTIPPLRLSL